MPISTRSKSQSQSVFAAAKNLLALKRTPVTQPKKQQTGQSRPSRRCAKYTPGMYTETDE